MSDERYYIKSAKNQRKQKLKPMYERFRGSEIFEDVSFALLIWLGSITWEIAYHFFLTFCALHFFNETGLINLW